MTIPFGSSSTADQVLAGIDLSGKHMIVTGCTSGLGYETMSALTANGAHVFGLARSLDAAAAACKKAGPFTTPIACDLSDFGSIDAAAESIFGQGAEIDVIVANAAVAFLPSPEVKYGIERQFLVNHLGHFALIRALKERIRRGSGRIVVVSASAGTSDPPPSGIDFDNIDGSRGYKPLAFYAQSKLANALYARELSRRLAPLGIAVNSVHPGAARGTRLHQSSGLASRLALAAAQMFMRSPAQGAATQALLAGSPLVEGDSGEHWYNCRATQPHPLHENRALAARLWEFSEAVLAKHARRDHSLQQAA